MRSTGFKINGKRKYRVDFVLLFAVLLLVSFGILMVYSASYYSAELTYGDRGFFMKKQLFGAIIGLVGMIVMYFINYEKLKKISLALFIVSVVLLGLVFIPHIGVKVYGARRWINLGVTTIQPSEIAKFAFVLFASTSLAKMQRKVKSFKGILPTI